MLLLLAEEVLLDASFVFASRCDVLYQEGRGVPSYCDLGVLHA